MRLGIDETDVSLSQQTLSQQTIDTEEEIEVVDDDEEYNSNTEYDNIDDNSRITLSKLSHFRPHPLDQSLKINEKFVLVYLGETDLKKMKPDVVMAIDGIERYRGRCVQRYSPNTVGSFLVKEVEELSNSEKRRLRYYIKKKIPVYNVEDIHDLIQRELNNDSQRSRNGLVQKIFTPFSDRISDRTNFVRINPEAELPQWCKKRVAPLIRTMFGKFGGDDLKEVNKALSGKRKIEQIITRASTSEIVNDIISNNNNNKIKTSSMMNKRKKNKKTMMIKKDKEKDECVTTTLITKEEEQNSSSNNNNEDDDDVKATAVVGYNSNNIVVNDNINPFLKPMRRVVTKPKMQIELENVYCKEKKDIKRNKLIIGNNLERCNSLLLPGEKVFHIKEHISASFFD